MDVMEITDGYPTDSEQGYSGYCYSYNRIPHDSWLRVDGLAPDQTFNGVDRQLQPYILSLMARGGSLFQVYASPRILSAVRHYQELNNQPEYLEKSIFFKYRGKTVGRLPGYTYHCFQLILF